MDSGRDSAGVNRSLSLLSELDRRRYYRLTTLRSIVSLLDLVSLTLLGGLLAYLSNNDLFKKNSIAQSTLEQLSDTVIPLEVLWLIAILFVFVNRSVFSVLISMRLSNMLASVESNLALSKANELFKVDLGLLGARNRFELAYGLVPGAAAAVTRVLSAISIVISETVGLISICVFLLIVNPLIAIIVILYLALVGWSISFMINRRAEFQSDKYAINTVNAIRSFEDLLEAQKEIRLRGSESDFLSDFGLKKKNSADSLSRLSILGITPRYVMDLAIVIGIFLVALVAFIGNDQGIDASTLALFATAGLRLGPSLLSIQGGMSAMKMGVGESRRYFNEVEGLLKENEIYRLNSEHGQKEPGRSGFGKTNELRLVDVSYSFPNQEVYALNNINFQIDKGSHVAIIGSSGSGKSTLADLILGLLTPTIGEVTYNGLDTADLIGRENSPFGYVPQRPAMLSTTIRDNVTLRKNGPSDISKDAEVNDALKKAGLVERIERMPDGLDTTLGDQGHGLSGGELQRLGIARALFLHPEVLLLDEFTSSLDAATEKSVLNSVLEFAQDITLIVIAHKISTIKGFDRVIVIENGRVLSDGNPDDLLANHESLQ